MPVIGTVNENVPPDNKSVTAEFLRNPAVTGDALEE
jgi:hypothetical protein